MEKQITENISQCNQHTNGCTAMIDFAIANDSTSLITDEIAEKHQQDFLNNIMCNKIFDLMVSVAFGKLENRFNRIVLNFDGSRIPTHIDLASEIGCCFVVLVSTGTENPITFNAVNSNPMPLCVMGDPYRAFREILRELADRFEKPLITRDSSTCSN